MVAIETEAERLVSQLVTDGITVLPPFVEADQLAAMQRAFGVHLSCLRWNDIDGYEKELHRHVVQNVLTLDHAFVDAGLHPLVKGTLRRYFDADFALVEAKGWRSLPTKRDFHGWHADAWYDVAKSPGMPMEVKLAIYLTDVRTGAFNYVKGTHRKEHPRRVRNSEIGRFPDSKVLEITGPAGTAFLFDTSGIHRQGVPILEPREAIFYNYHDPKVPLQRESIEYYRYHPLILNAAFLGNLTSEDQFILGFGNKDRYQPAFQRTDKNSLLRRVFTSTLGVKLRIDDLRERIGARLKRS
jgi:Phytanoyl-CoA dioxygenase (PhyH)